MRFACPYRWLVAPATCALCVRRFGHRSACFFRLVNCQITHNKEFFQFLFIDLLCNVGIRIQQDPRFQRVANQFFLARPLDRLSNRAAQSQKIFNLIDCFPAPILRLREFLHMN